MGLALVLEDDPAFCTIIIDLLTEAGLEPHVCSSYAELHAAAAMPGVRLVLADYWGPSHVELSAAEQEEIRELGRRAPTLLLTGRTWARPALAEELGVVAVLTKPIDVEPLLAQVRRCLDVSQTR